MRRTTGTGHTGQHTNHWARRAAALAALAALGIAACGNDVDQSASTEAPADLAIAGGELVAEGEPAVESADVPEGAAPATGGSAPTGLPFDETFGRDLIVEMGLTMSTANVARTLDDVRSLTTANGGSIFRADVAIGEQLEDGSVNGGGTVVVKIPPALLDGLVTDLSGVARVSNVSQQTEDVTDQLIDLEIRIRQARTGIEQIEALYAQATELEDLIDIEQELARRQIELERLLAAERGVEGRVALATLTVSIRFDPVPTDEVVEEEPVESDGIADAFRDGWDAFAGAMFAVGFVLAIAAPFLALVGAVLAAAWFVTRLRRRPPSATHPATRTSTHPVAEPVTEPGPDLVGATHED
ncbi:MAG: DUF4349 domain-containing protein [Ilumatobacteraceae bacterium]